MGSRIPSFDLTRQPAPRSESTGDFRPDGTASFDNILKDSVDGIFVENAEITVGVDVQFECFQLETFLIRHVVQCNGSEIRQVGFGANRCILRDLNRNLISLILIRESLDVGQRGADSTLRVPFVVA